MAMAKQQGFGVMVLYVGVAPELLAIRRVAERALSGGHDVPVEHIRRRYRSSLGHLAEALIVADQAVLYDNSANAERGPRVFAEVENGVLTALEQEPPEWLTRALGPIAVDTNLRDLGFR